MATRASVPFFALSVKGHLTDSTPTPSLLPSSVHPVTRACQAHRERGRLVELAPCVPYFELAIVGTLRV